MLAGSELTSIEDIVISTILEVTIKLGLGGSNEHIGHKESMVGTSADDSNPDSVFGIPAGIPINYVQFTTSVEVTLGEF